MTSNSDHNLLFGIIALQMDFVRREQLVGAASVWLADRSRRIEEILVEQGALGEADRELLAPLVARHLENHGGDPQRSLAALSSVGAVADEFRSLGDEHIDDTLSMMASERASDQHAETVLQESRGNAAAAARAAPDARFRILRSHAKGGLGEVYVAKDTELNREVALKEIQSQYADDQASRLRFLLEAEVTGGLEHPGIVPVYGLGQYHDGRPYYAMRFIRGDSLTEAISLYHATHPNGDSSPAANLELRKLLGRFLDVCNAMQYAHSRGVLHRDLKPGNVMLGKYGETLVVDWGLAKLQGQNGAQGEAGEPALHVDSESASETQFGSALGTPAYMPPEQAAGRLDQLGPASDVYSLGATLYHILTGQAPVKGGDVLEVLAGVRRGEFPSPRQLRGDIPQPLEAVCLRTMQKLPDDRYASPQEVADDVERWLADEPVSACTEPVRVRARRWIRKHPRIVSSLAATVLVGLTALTVVAAIVSSKNHALAKANGDLKLANDAERNATRLANTKRREAEDAKREEAKARGQAVAVSNFLVQAFQRTDPNIDGRTITVAEILNDAAAKLDEQFAQQPEVKAHVIGSLGNAYMNLGMPRKAAPLFSEQLGLTTDVAEKLIAEFSLASALHRSFQLDEAIQLYRKNLAGREKEFGPEHEYTFMAVNHLAESLRLAQKTPQCIELIEKAIVREKKALGEDHPVTLRAMNILAIAYNQSGDIHKGQSLVEQVWQLQKEKLGPDHVDTLITMSNLAGAYMDAGQREKAVEMLKKALPAFRRKLGDDHPDTIIVIDKLATAYLHMGLAHLAMPLLEEAVQRARQTFAENHPVRLRVEAKLALASVDMKQPERAITILDRILPVMRGRLLENHRWTLGAVNTLARAHSDLGNHDRALSLYEECFRASQQSLGDDHPETLAHMYVLARGYRAAGQYDKAVSLMERELKMTQAKLGETHPDAIGSMGTLGNTYLMAGQNEKGVAMLKRFVDAWRPHMKEQQLANLLAQVAQQLMAFEQYAAAESHFREVHAIQDKSAPDQWGLFVTKTLIGRALLKQKQYAEAEPLLLAGYQGLEQRQAELPPAARQHQQNARQWIIELYTAWNKPKEVEEWKAKREQLEKDRDPR